MHGTVIASRYALNGSWHGNYETDRGADSWGNDQLDYLCFVFDSLPICHKTGYARVVAEEILEGAYTRANVSKRGGVRSGPKRKSGQQ